LAIYNNEFILRHGIGAKKLITLSFNNDKITATAVSTYAVKVKCSLMLSVGMLVCQQSVLKVTSSVIVGRLCAFGWNNIF